MAKINSNSRKKEVRQLLETKVANMPLDTSNRLKYLVTNIENSLTNKDNKIDLLIQEIDKKFPPHSPQRGLFDGFASMVFDTAYSLYILNNNSALIIELHGILERFCLNALCDTLPINDIAKVIIDDMLDKRTLKDIVHYFEKLGLWNKDDVTFALELTKLRNGIAHKNAELVSRSKLANSNGQNGHPESIHTIMSTVDCSTIIVNTMDLIIKGSGMASQSFIKQPRLHARYNVYLSLIGELYNLFLANPYTQKGNPLLESYINDRLAKAYIIGSDELVNCLREFRSKVLSFHKALERGDKVESKSIHSEFGEILHQILIYMRKDLNVDCPEREFIDEPTIIDVEEYIKSNKENFS